ncbi:MAG: dephospho-CoA kinase [Bacteroidales bacterium]|nr:dephospho-CoA kinase [Bacteroidales bacterium]
MPGKIAKPLKIGVTGGFGSGKTSVCRVFSILGVPVFYADPEARAIMESDKSVIEKIKSAVKKDVYASGSLDRQMLADLIFKDESLLKKINSIVHPALYRHFLQWSEKQDAPYVIIEAAILIESGGRDYVDKIISVIAPLEERIARITLKNKLTREQVMERIRNQTDDDTRIKYSDYVIYNSDDDMIIPEILRIHEDILKSIKTS